MRSKKILSNDIYEKSSIEYQLIECLNNEPLTFIEKPINLISKKLHINTSTLTRTIRKIGFNNYKIFRNFVIAKVTEYKDYLIVNKIIKKTNKIVHETVLSSNLAIEETLGNIADNVIHDEAINKIITAKRILLFGIGFSHFICQQMAKYFQLYNLNGYSILSFYDALQLVNISSDDLWIIVSITLTTREITFLLKELTSYKKNQIILITSNTKNKILEKVSYVFKLKVQESKQDDEIFNLNLKVALSALVSLIIFEVVNKVNDCKFKKSLELNKQINKRKK